MKILLFHPVHLPPRDYGGVERVVLWLGEALRDLGHSVSIAALGGSRLPKGVSLVPVQRGTSPESILKRETFDLVHFHSPVPPELRLSVPFVVTIHGNGKPGERFHQNTLFLTHDHARRHGRESYVHNGANPAEFHFRSKKRPSAKPLFLSKTSWKVKNLAGAMALAHEAKSGLTITGGYRPFTLWGKSWLWGFDWVGPVAGDEKARFLAEASCLLFPVKWPEPFGLVMIEAMFSGTPVIAPEIGSVPEVIGRSGGVVVPEGAPHEAWIQAIRGAKRWEPIAVRESALTRFTHWKMAESYLEYYRRAIRGEIWK